MFHRNSIKIALVLMATLACAAAAKPNFSGEWKLNPQKSDFGPMPAPDSATLKIDHNEPELKVSSTTATAQGEMKNDAKYTTDGKECTNTMGPMQVKSTAKWEGDELAMSGKMEFNGMEITMKGKWVLSADGKTITQTSHLVSPQGEIDMKAVYEKQTK